ncbi:MAG: hypothetical protein L0Y54_18180 [Sporichthyaceae bacterium]|nr:hypothetical protein [Sporichthyaceae bacterium]
MADGAVSFAGLQIPVPGGDAGGRSDGDVGVDGKAGDGGGKAGRQVILGIRPTGFAAAGNGWPTLPVVPEVVEELGDERYVIFDVDAPRMDTEDTRAAIEARAADDALLVPEDRARFTVRLPTDVPIEVGQATSLAINPDRLYFFDPDSGLALRHPADQRRDQD